MIIIILVLIVNFLCCFILFIIKNQTCWKSFWTEVHFNLQHLHPIWWIPVKFVLLRDSQVFCFLLQTWSVAWRRKWWQPILSADMTWNSWSDTSSRGLLGFYCGAWSTLFYSQFHIYCNNCMQDCSRILFLKLSLFSCILLKTHWRPTLPCLARNSQQYWRW